MVCQQLLASCVRDWSRRLTSQGLTMPRALDEGVPRRLGEATII